VYILIYWKYINRRRFIMSEDNKEVEVKGEVTINKNGDNNIQISDDVVSVIAGMAAAEVPGVSEMADRK